MNATKFTSGIIALANVFSCALAVHYAAYGVATLCAGMTFLLMVLFISEDLKQ